MPLGSLIRPVTGRAGNGTSLPVYSVTKHRGFVPSVEYFKKQVFAKDLSTYKVVEPNQFAYATIHLDEGSIGFAPESCLVSPMYTVFSVDYSLVDRDYLFAYLKSDRALRTYESLGKGSAERRRSISLESLGRLVVRLPSLPEQRRIASILNEAQRVLELCRRSVLAGDVLESALLVELMSKAEESERPVRLDSVAETLTGPFGSALHRADYAPGGVPIVNPMHIVAGQINTSDDFAVGAEKSSELTAYRLRVNDVVLGRRGELGRAAAVREEHLPALCGTGSMIVRPHRSNLPAAYLAGVLASPSIKRRLESQAQGATMLNLNQSIVGALPIAVPSDQDLQEFDMRLAVVRKLKDSFLQRLRVQQQLVDTLQARAFRGEL